MTDATPRVTPQDTPLATPLARRLAQSQGIALETLSLSLAPPNAQKKQQKKIKANDVLDALEISQKEISQKEISQKEISQKEISQKEISKETSKNERSKSETRLFSSPLARARAKEAGIDLALLQGKGSGPQGRIVRQDIEQALTQSLTQGLQAEQTAALPVALPLETPFELRPHTRMREVIAERLTLSKQTIPHFTLTTACRIDALLSLREQLNHHFYEQHRAKSSETDKEIHKETQKPFKLSVNDLLVKALALSLEMCPDANVAWTDEGMKHFQRVDVAVAVAIPGGLITPIVRDAASKPLVVLARALHALIARARLGKLQPQDYTGGTVSISNLGMFGIHAFQAIINPPQAAILAVGAAEKVLVKNALGEIVRRDAPVRNPLRRPPRDRWRCGSATLRALQAGDRTARFAPSRSQKCDVKKKQKK